MLRGTCRFRCDECDNTFDAPDIEYAASTLSYPQKCPKCGSMHTWPQGMLGKLLGKRDPNRLMYKTIWERLD